MDINLTNKKALVCGSTQGIGWATAMELASLGCEVVLFARNEKALAQRVEELKAQHKTKASYLVADFNKPEEVQEVIGAYLKNNSAFHILINNSGGPAAGKIQQAKFEDFHLALQRHLMVNHGLSMALLPGMGEAGYGRVVNIVSTSVYEPIPGLGVSNTTRGAVAAWAKTLSSEVAEKGITVNNVLPGATWTERLKSIIENKADAMGISFEEAKANMIAQIPARRLAEASETAQCISFLASPAASYITGQSIAVDGGRMNKI